MKLWEVIQSVKDILQYDAADAAIQARLDRAIPKALNQARIWAERKNDWAMSHGSLWYQVSAANGNRANLQAGYFSREDLVTVPDPDVRTTYKMKSVTGVFMELNDGTLRQVMIRPTMALQRLELQEQELRSPWWTVDQPIIQEPPTTTVFSIHGGFLTMDPGVDGQIIRVDGFKWMPVYSGDFSPEMNDYEDFFLEHCTDMLIWKAVLDCNYITQTFVNRQEGNVGTPTGMLEEAYDSALDWDRYQHQSGINYQLG